MLDDGTEISPTLARMLACDAGIIPAILNAHRQPVDVGRERRLYTGQPRTAIEIRDGGCTWPGCRAARHTEGVTQGAASAEPNNVMVSGVHHLIPWALGGRTDQTNGGLFCWHHHRE
ncbi:MAG: HNH endonuclease [Actinomycetota bacterium]|nr:HNH endonuclease [Actinomycetota bacterium]